MRLCVLFFGARVTTEVISIKLMIDFVDSLFFHCLFLHVANQNRIRIMLDSKSNRVSDYNCNAIQV